MHVPTFCIPNIRIFCKFPLPVFPVFIFTIFPPPFYKNHHNTFRIPTYRISLIPTSPIPNIPTTRIPTTCIPTFHSHRAYSYWTHSFPADQEKVGVKYYVISVHRVQQKSQLQNDWIRFRKPFRKNPNTDFFVTKKIGVLAIRGQFVHLSQHYIKKAHVAHLIPFQKLFTVL